MSTDPFSDVLRLTEAKSVVTGGFAAGGTWGIHVPAPQQIVFAVIAKGSCWMRLDNQKTALRLEQGDVGLLSGRSGFFLGSSLTAYAREVALTDKRGRVVDISAERETIVLSCRVSLDPSSAALITDALPARVHIRGSSPKAAGMKWLVEQMLEEATTGLPGTSVVSEKLAELLFVQILRTHVASAKTLPSGWLRATSDERIMRALRVMHDAPGREWTLDELAKAAAMSRTRFAVLFRSVAGVAPLAYLGEWRMRLAQRVLRDEDISIVQLAESLGYTSESAFSNAFKRITGTAPRNFRKATRSAAAERGTIAQVFGPAANADFEASSYESRHASLPHGRHGLDRVGNHSRAGG